MIGQQTWTDQEAIYRGTKSDREIAAMLQLKEKSVKVLLFRARRKMEAILKDHGFEGSHD